MNTDSSAGLTDLDQDTDSQVNDMTDRIRKDVASWSAARHDAPANLKADRDSPARKPALARTSARAKPVVAAAPKVLDTGKKPFKMSYDGVSDSDYITDMIARGAR
jgi:hypothetical protein